MSEINHPVIPEPDHKYLIWSIPHGCWWRSNSAGYTDDVRDAGRYDRKTALAKVSYRADGIEPPMYSDMTRRPDQLPIREDVARDIVDARSGKEVSTFASGEFALWRSGYKWLRKGEPGKRIGFGVFKFTDDVSLALGVDGSRVPEYVEKQWFLPVLFDDLHKIAPFKKFLNHLEDAFVAKLLSETKSTAGAATHRYSDALRRAEVAIEAEMPALREPLRKLANKIENLVDSVELAISSDEERVRKLMRSIILSIAKTADHKESVWRTENSKHVNMITSLRSGELQRTRELSAERFGEMVGLDKMKFGFEVERILKIKADFYQAIRSATPNARGEPEIEEFGEGLIDAMKDFTEINFVRAKAKQSAVIVIPEQTPPVPEIVQYAAPPSSPSMR